MCPPVQTPLKTWADTQVRPCMLKKGHWRNQAPGKIFGRLIL